MYPAALGIFLVALCVATQDSAILGQVRTLSIVHGGITWYHAQGVLACTYSALQLI